MKKIIQIAKVELSVLFYSPVAWLVLAIFMVQCGITFYDSLLQLRTALSIGMPAGAITASLLGGRLGGLANVIQGYLFLYMPILTMGLMSRETSSGSIKLLLSSPVKVREIILGKYLAIITFGLGFLAIMGFYDVIGIFVIKNIDYGVLGASMLAIFLLICTYAAIGLFMSCLTSYQIVAVISTIVLFSALRYVGSVGQDIDLVRDLTYFVSISGRTEKMTLGLITSKDIFYYLIIITFFLGLAILRVRSTIESKPWLMRAARYGFLVVAALALGYFTSRPALTGYLDASQGQSQTLTKASQAISEKMKGDVKVSTYVNLLAPDLFYLLPVSRNYDLSNWEQYQRFIPGMKMEYVYYYQKPVDPANYDFKDSQGFANITDIRQIAQRAAENLDINGKLFMPPEQINKRIDLKPEGYLNVRRIEYNGKSTYLRFYQNDVTPYAYETEVNAALKRLLLPAPKVAFLSGRGQRSTFTKEDQSYQMASALKVRRYALINQGFEVQTVDIEQGTIPADTQVVVVADPSQPLSPMAIARLRSYLDAGGNMLITTEPGQSEVINPLLSVLDLELGPGVLLGSDKNITAGYLSAHVSQGGRGLDPFFADLRNKSSTVAIQGAATLVSTTNGRFAAVPLLEAPAGTRQAALGSARDPVSGAVLPVRTSAPSPVEVQSGSLAVAVALTRSLAGKEQRIVVSGDADFMSNGEWSRSQRGDNQNYMFGIFSWLSGGQFPIDTPRSQSRDTDLLVSRETIKVLMWVSKAILPMLLILLGAVLLLRRRGK